MKENPARNSITRMHLHSHEASHPPHYFYSLSKEVAQEFSQRFDIPHGILTTNAQMEILTVNVEMLLEIQYEEEDILGANISNFVLNLENIPLGLTQMTVKRKDGTEFNAFVQVSETKSHMYRWFFHEINIDVGYILARNDIIVSLYQLDHIFPSSPRNNLSNLIPKFNPEQATLFCGVSGSGDSFPLKATLVKKAEIPMEDGDILLEVESMSDIAGLITTCLNGKIQTINSDFAEKLFGRTQSELLTMNIVDIIPDIMLFDQRRNDSRYIVSDRRFGNCVEPQDAELSPTILPTIQKNNARNIADLRYLYAIHSDGSQIKVSVHSLKSNTDRDCFWGFWICFHRNAINHDDSKRVNIVQEIMEKLELDEPGEPEFPAVIKDAKILDIDDFDVIDSLGEGAYSFVKLCTYNQDSSKVNLFKKTRLVIKYVVRHRVLAWSRVNGVRIPLEVKILQELAKNPHPRIIRIQHHFFDMYYSYVIMNHTHQTDLFEFIENNEDLTNNTRRFIFRQVLEGVKHIHSLGIVHRDIKDENILLDNQQRVKIIDFGSSAFIADGPFNTFHGTQTYAAPEVLEGECYDGVPQDCWQCGTLLYILLFRDGPFETVEDTLECQLKPGLDLDPVVMDLLLGFLNRKPELRLTASDALKHKWYNLNLLGLNEIDL